MNTNTHPSSTASLSRRLLTSVRDDLRERREARAVRRKLQRELATYSTRAEVDDLMALLHHQESAQADQVRGILLRNLHRSDKLAS
jgi:hypothetical protein